MIGERENGGEHRRPWCDGGKVYVLSYTVWMYRVCLHLFLPLQTFISIKFVAIYDDDFYVFFFSHLLSSFMFGLRDVKIFFKLQLVI